MADIQKLNVNGNTYDISTTWAKVTGKPSTFTPSSHTHSYLPLSGGTLTGSVTMNGIDTSLIRNITYYATTGWARDLITLKVDGVTKFSFAAFGSYTSGATDNGITFAYLGMDTYNGTNLRIYGTGTNSIKWGDNNLLHAGNYNSYVPTLKGTGASGTWGINISGNAATATNATNATNADKLDGYHKDEILRKTTNPTSVTSLNDVVTRGIDFTSWSYSESAKINNQPNGNGASSAASVVSFGTTYPFQIYSDYNDTSSLYYRSYYSGTGWKAWRRFAFIDSNVASATKLSSNAGSATNPIYFSGGKPVACTYSLNKTVPSNAVFTDTNTWRPVTNTYTGSDQSACVSQYGTNALYNALLNGYASSAGSATKLQDNTVFTAWGQTFFENGKPKNVSGDLSMGRSRIYWNGDIRGSYISSNGTDTMIYNIRDGHSFRVDGDEILSIMIYGNYNLQVNGSANATSLYENGTRVALSGHTHDDRYYTESEVTNLLAGKANSSHGTHLSGSAALYSNSSQGVNCNDVTYNLIGYYVSNGPSTSLGASTNDGTLYSQAYSSSWVSQIAQDYRNGHLFTRGKNNGTWTAWKAVSYNGHTHKYAGSSSAGGAATSVVVADSNANSTYRMVWHSGNSLYSTDNIYCNPSTDYLYSKGFYQTSDERLKTFYDPIKVDLDKLSKLRKNYFKFNDKNKLEIGVSAQEVQSIYPEIVSTDDNGYLSVAYDKLSVIALAAIDELDNKYKKEINDLKDQLDAIKNILNEKGIV